MTIVTSLARRAAAPCVALFTAAFLAACGGQKGADTAAPPVVLAATDVAPVSTAEIGSTVVVSGVLDPADVVSVRAQLAGTLREILVDRGAKVSRGQALARIETAGVTTGLEAAKAGVASAEALLVVAQQRRDGAKKLFDAGAMSIIDYKSAVAGYDAAVAQLGAARTQFASATEMAGHTRLIAPMDGWVSERFADANESIRSDDPVFTVVDPRTLELKGQVGALDAARVRVGQVVTFTLDASPGKVFKGIVARVDPVANAATRQVGVFAHLPNGNGAVVAGQFAHGRIHSGAAVKTLVAPVTAIRGEGTQTYVLVINGGQVVRRPVTTGVRDEDAGVVAITNGLQAGERIVVSAGVDLADGTKVATAKEK